MSLVGCTKHLTKEKTFNFLHKAHASIRKVVQVYKAQTGSVVIMANIVSLCPYSNSGPEDPVLFSAATPTLESRRHTQLSSYIETTTNPRTFFPATWWFLCAHITTREKSLQTLSLPGFQSSNWQKRSKFHNGIYENVLSKRSLFRRKIEIDLQIINRDVSHFLFLEATCLTSFYL